MELPVFYAGSAFDAHQYLGGRLTGEGAVFRTFAPSAEKISLIGEFSGWAELPMERVCDGNFWERTVPGARAGMMYKFRVYQRDGRVLDRCDPYGYYMELRPNSASILWDHAAYRFQDEAWQKRPVNWLGEPLNIYEVHLGSWRQDPERPNGWYSYRELAEPLIAYARNMGYNALEFLPLAEHPSDQSWGYQITGFFSPTARYGTPDDLKYLVDRCHQAGLAVFMDFVPAHFAPDDYGLWNYDGAPLYQYPSPDVGDSAWGSCSFQHSRGEVRSFLNSAAALWLETYHFDGLRVDAVGNLIYWNGERTRGENQGGISFLRELNRGLKQRFPKALLMAEDSSAYPGVTAPADRGGLGFDLKWDLGWMHDTLSYFQSPPEERLRAAHRLTFSMAYFSNERYLLPLSHDEVVHGKATVLQKMYGDYDQKFPQARALYLYMTAHPGKKLNFMGNELGHFREWDESRELDWNLLDYPVHRGFQNLHRALNRLYLTCPALGDDWGENAFAWLRLGEDGAFAFLREGGGQRLLAVFNFLDRTQDLALTVDGAKTLELLLDTEDPAFGGGGRGEERVTLKQGGGSLTLPPYSGRVYRVE